MMRKREWNWVGLMGSLVACAAGLAVKDAFAQTYPAKPIRLIVGFAAGGSTDLIRGEIAQNVKLIQLSGMKTD